MHAMHTRAQVGGPPSDDGFDPLGLSPVAGPALEVLDAMYAGVCVCFHTGAAARLHTEMQASVPLQKHCCITPEVLTRPSPPPHLSTPCTAPGGGEMPP